MTSRPARWLPLILFAVALLLPAGGHAWAQGSAQGPAQGPADGVAIRDVIASQLRAFQRDDGPGAFAFASPSIRGKFQTPEIFMEMVRRHYAPVYRPSEVSFQALRASPRGPVQEVLLVGPDGRVVLALYFMERQPDASWRIDGVRLVDAPDMTS
jgi:hypothetical protein